MKQQKGKNEEYNLEKMKWILFRTYPTLVLKEWPSLKNEGANDNNRNRRNDYILNIK